MADTKLYKVIVMFDDGSIAPIAGVEHEGAIWLVPTWLPHPEPGFSTPERMLRLDQFPHERFDPPPKGPPPFDGADFHTTVPLSKALFVGPLDDDTRTTRPGVLLQPHVAFAVPLQSKH